MKIKSMILVFFLFAATLAANGPSPWELVRRDKNMTVFKRVYPGSSIYEFKAVAEDRARLEIVGVVLEDYPGYGSWIDYLVESRVVSQKDENHLVLYQRYKGSWPVDDRDCVTRVTIDRNYRTGRILVRMEAVKEPLVPLMKNTVRITDMTGSIMLEYVSREVTRGSFSMRLDFTGSMPVWLGNLITEQIPIRALEGLGRQAKNPARIRAGRESKYRALIDGLVRQGVLKK